MRRSSYLSRMARLGPQIGPSLVPARILFRLPPPIPDALPVEAPAIFPPEVTPVQTRQSRDPGEPIGNFTVPSEGSVPARNDGAPVLPKPPSAPLTPLLSTEGSPRRAARGEAPPSTQISGPVPVLDPPRFLSAKKLVSAELESIELHLEETRKQAPALKPGGHTEARARSSNATEGALNSKLADTPKPPSPLAQRASSAPQGTVGQAHGQGDFRSNPVSQRASETSRPILIHPPPVRREAFAAAESVTEKRASMSKEIGTAVHIGALEVRIMPPPPIAPPVSTTFVRQSAAPHPQAALSHGFSSFGLTQG
jgi:hypothetical protein